MIFGQGDPVRIPRIFALVLCVIYFHTLPIFFRLSRNPILLCAGLLLFWESSVGRRRASGILRQDTRYVFPSHLW